jgi:hypothetical protein
LANRGAYKVTNVRLQLGANYIKKMKFILVFYAIFLGVSMFICLLDRTHEMFGFAIYANLIYIITGGPPWYVTNKFISNKSPFKILLKYFIGLLILNILIFIFSKDVMSLVLIGLVDKHANWFVSLFIHAIYTVAFIAAVIQNLKEDKNTKRLSNEDNNLSTFSS